MDPGERVQCLYAKSWQNLSNKPSSMFSIIATHPFHWSQRFEALADPAERVMTVTGASEAGAKANPPEPSLDPA